MSDPAATSTAPVERQRLEVDIAGVGFGPAMGGFLTTLSQNMLNEDGSPRFESTAAPGLPLQVVCYERADGLGCGVSGAVTRARSIRGSFPELDCSQIPMAVPVAREKLIYLLDPIAASRRSLAVRFADRMIRAFGPVLGVRDHALALPYTPPFLKKHEGIVLSLGQFNQWVGEQITSSGNVQLWPGMPVSEPLIEHESVKGIRLSDQGVSLDGLPADGFMPGMDVYAGLTVVADGPVGAVGRKLDSHFGLPGGNKQDEWALGMKMVIELPEGTSLEPGTVIHTLGFPEPEIFGFLYVHPDRLVSVGIFVPSWLRSPVRTGYRYLQHFILHPYLWKYLQGGTLKSWGAKSLQESGRRGEPCLAGNGYARIGEGSGSTNILAASGVDEAWTTGVLLAEAVIELLEKKRPFTRENLENAYLLRRRGSWIDHESRAAANSRNGFRHGVISGLFGMALAGFTNGKMHLPAWKREKTTTETLEKIYGSHLSYADLKHLQAECAARGLSLHDAIMDRSGWPSIPFDGRLLITHQDALLMGGAVQASPGYANHVTFLRPELCQPCEPKLCVEMCSGQAITRGENGVPAFDREKCVFCGACLWNCQISKEGEKGNIEFRAGAGGLHSSLN